MTAGNDAIEIVKTWLEAECIGERHLGRVRKLEKYLKRHKALEVLSLDKIEFLITGRQEVLISRKGSEGFLVNLSPDDAAKARLSVGEGSILADAVAQFFWKTAYARNRQGHWERLY